MTVKNCLLLAALLVGVMLSAALFAGYGGGFQPAAFAQM